MAGDPNLDLASTSYAERNNLTMRMGMRRLTRLTNGFSKKIENHAHAVNLHMLHYNFACPHQTLAKRATPLRWRQGPSGSRGPSRRSQNCWTRNALAPVA